MSTTGLLSKHYWYVGFTETETWKHVCHFQQDHAGGAQSGVKRGPHCGEKSVTVCPSDWLCSGLDGSWGWTCCLQVNTLTLINCYFSIIQYIMRRCIFEMVLLLVLYLDKETSPTAPSLFSVVDCVLSLQRMMGRRSWLESTVAVTWSVWWVTRKGVAWNKRFIKSLLLMLLKLFQPFIFSKKIKETLNNIWEHFFYSQTVAW